MTEPSNAVGQGIEMVKLVNQYGTAWSKLATARGKMFPVGARVKVDCLQYHGPGQVACDPDCAIDKLPVLLENGNVWWYPLLACEPIKETV